MNTLKNNRIFQRIICHRIFINLADSLFYIVLMWVLYDLTNNSFYTAIGGFMFSLSDVLNFFAGPLIDRSDKEKLLVIASGTAFFVIAGLFFCSFADTVPIWIFIFSIPLFNLMSRITYSVHNVIIPSVVSKEELVSANSILSVTNTGIDLLFNAVSGILLVVLSLQEVFFINSTVNLLALLVAFITFRHAVLLRKQTISQNLQNKQQISPAVSITANKKEHQFQNFLISYQKDLKNRLTFIKNQTVLSLIIPLVGLNLLYAMMLVNLPEFSSKIFGSAIGYGFVLTFFAVGSISGSIASNFLLKRFSVGKLIPVLFLYGGVSWILMTVFIKSLPLIGVLFMVAAMNALGIINIIFGTLFQQLPPENMIGRVNTVNLSFMAVAALIGSLLGGFVAQTSDVLFSFTLCGLGYLIISFMMQMNRFVRNLPKMNKINEKTL